MHITFWLTSYGQEKLIRLPSANLHLFQGTVYSLLPPKEAAFLHDTGYKADGKNFKLFAMGWPSASSVPQTEGEGQDKKLFFQTPIRITISTSQHNLAMGFIDGAFRKSKLRIGNNTVLCRRVEAEQQTADRDTVTVKTLSPITCYETVSLRGRPYTIFFKPDEREFQRSIHDNLLHKFRAVFPDREPPMGELSISPLGETKERISLFDPKNEFPIKGWWGRFRLHGPKELLQVALDCGVGAKNSTGWGCISKEALPEAERPIKEERRQTQNESNGDDMRDEHPDERG